MPDLCSRCHEVVGRLLAEGRAELDLEVVVKMDGRRLAVGRQSRQNEGLAFIVKQDGGERNGRNRTQTDLDKARVQSDC